MAVALLLPGQLRAKNPTLTGTVGPGFTISLEDENGHSVSTLPAGTYTIVVHDKSNMHNFHLTGPGVDKSTDIDGTDDDTWTVTLSGGTYKFHCDVHPTQMKGSFSVTLSLELAVSKSGDGAGSVTSSPDGLDCGSTCTAPFSKGAKVTLTATPDDGSTFTGWGGACSGTGACSVTIDADATVTAGFSLSRLALTVARTGTGSGAVTSAPAAVDCGGTCTATFGFGTAVTLTATPATGSAFEGWSGACSGTGPCTVTMTAARSVTAAFALQHFRLAVLRGGKGSGTVSSAPAGIACGASCSAEFAYGTAVTLTPRPLPASSFAGWRGACVGTGRCSVTVTEERAVTAMFAPAAIAATVVARGGHGAVDVRLVVDRQLAARMTLRLGTLTVVTRAVGLHAGRQTVHLAVSAGTYRLHVVLTDRRGPTRTIDREVRST